MRVKLFVVLESVFLGLGLLVMPPTVNPTIAGGTSNPPQMGSMPQATRLPAQPISNRSSKTRPLAVWDCTSSWYGEPFDGQPTATGEIYDMYAITAAHPTLPLGSIVRVVNPRNHRSLVVRINDRGPYVEGRGLDVSYEVARRLGFDQRGLETVQLQLLEVPSRPASAHLD